MRKDNVSEMARVMCGREKDCLLCPVQTPCLMRNCAELLNAEGYRKASEFAAEFIEEIDNALHDMAMDYANTGHKDYFAVCEMVYHKVIRPIQKKYTEEGK